MAVKNSLTKTPTIHQFRKGVSNPPPPRVTPCIATGYGDSDSSAKNQQDFIDLNKLATNGETGMSGYFVARSSVADIPPGSFVVTDPRRRPRNGNIILIAGIRGPEVCVYGERLRLIECPATPQLSGDIIGIVRASLNFFNGEEIPYGNHKRSRKRRDNMGNIHRFRPKL